MDFVGVMAAGSFVAENALSRAEIGRMAGLATTAYGFSIQALCRRAVSSELRRGQGNVSAINFFGISRPNAHIG